MDCSYIGDSIAVGSQWSDRQCRVHARVGASSEFIRRNYSARGGEDYTVISMGSNDPYNSELATNARAVRNSVHSKRVVWILPYNSTAASVIRDVANAYGDRYVELRSTVRAYRDGVHPRSYATVGRAIQDRLR